MRQMQKTLQREVIFEGIGIHSAQPSKIVLKPAPSDFGVVFENPLFPNEVFKIGSVSPEVSVQATVVKSSKWILSTIEHLLATLTALGVDNVLIEVNGSEIPILDGSALGFVQEILDCGFVQQRSVKRFLTPRERLKFEDNKNGRIIEIYPMQDDDKRLHLDYTAEFSNNLVGCSQLQCVLTSDFFVQDIAPARTFGFLEQIKQIRELGLGKGTSLGNTLVLSKEGFLNEPRFENECVRHKVLDLIGDIGLLGLTLAGRVVAVKTGHSFNREIVSHYLSKPDSWEIIL